MLKRDNKKSLILIGSMEWFADSYLLYKELGYSIYVIKFSKCIDVYMPNYSIFKSLGAQIFEYNDNLNEILEHIPINEYTIVCRGSYYGKTEPNNAIINPICRLELDIFDKILSLYKAANGVVYISGDTSFSDEEDIRFFKEKTKFVKIVVAENKESLHFLCELVPKFKDVVFVCGCFAAPLERFVVNRKYNKNFINKPLNLGRNFGVISHSQFDNISYYDTNNIKFKKFKLFLNKIFNFNIRTWLSYRFAGFETLNNLYQMRKFFKFENKHIFGLSHFYTTEKLISLNSSEVTRNTYISSKHLIRKKNFKIAVPYIYLNVANKDFNYLMLGIIPIIPKVKNSFYRNLLNNGMALEIDQNYTNISLNMSPSEIQKYFNNIFKHKNLFCTDSTIHEIVNIVKQERDHGYEKN